MSLPQIPKPYSKHILYIYMNIKRNDTLDPKWPHHRVQRCDHKYMRPLCVNAHENLHVSSSILVVLSLQGV